MNFTAKDVAELRQITGAGMMDCKAALQEANGSMEKAKELLRQKGIVAAAKKAEKSALEGIVVSKISDDKKCGVILEINTQTDFVAKNDKFQELAKTIAEIAVSNKPKTLDDLLKSKTKEGSLSDLISSRISTIGENIQIRRFEFFELKESGILGSYIHPVGNKIGVLVKLVAKSDILKAEDLAKSIAMHVAAATPQPEFVDKNEIPKEFIENEKRIEMGKEDLAKKPKEIAEKIVQGRLDKILAQRCLLDQPFIKDQNITVGQLLNNVGKDLGIEIQISGFVRYNVGESTDKSSNPDQDLALTTGLA